MKAKRLFKKLNELINGSDSEIDNVHLTDSLLTTDLINNSTNLKYSSQHLDQYPQQLLNNKSSFKIKQALLKPVIMKPNRNRSPSPFRDKVKLKGTCGAKVKNIKLISIQAYAVSLFEPYFMEDYATIPTNTSIIFITKPIHSTMNIKNHLLKFHSTILLKYTEILKTSAISEYYEDCSTDQSNIQLQNANKLSQISLSIIQVSINSIKDIAIKLTENMSNCAINSGETSYQKIRATQSITDNVFSLPDINLTESSRFTSPTKLQRIMVLHNVMPNTLNLPELKINDQNCCTELESDVYCDYINITDAIKQNQTKSEGPKPRFITSLNHSSKESFTPNLTNKKPRSVKTNAVKLYNKWLKSIYPIGFSKSSCSTSERVEKFTLYVADDANCHTLFIDYYKLDFAKMNRDSFTKWCLAKSQYNTVDLYDKLAKVSNGFIQQFPKNLLRRISNKRECIVLMSDRFDYNSGKFRAIQFIGYQQDQVINCAIELMNTLRVEPI